MTTVSPRRVVVAGKIHAAGITLDVVEAVTTEAYRPQLATADAILIRTQPMGAAEIALAPKLRIVSRHGVGYDAIDVAALNARPIPLAGSDAPRRSALADMWTAAGDVAVQVLVVLALLALLAAAAVPLAAEANRANRIRI